jgi:hypothetical protein
MTAPDAGAATPNLFVSWSGPRARSLAEALSQWLPGVLPTYRPWISSRQRRGTDWAAVLFERIAAARATVVCLTSDSIAAPWMLFEAGLLGARGDRPLALYVLDVEQDELASSAVGAFPAFPATERGTAGLVELLNGSSDHPLPEENVATYLAGSWSDLERQLSCVPPPDVRPFTAYVYMADLCLSIEVGLDTDRTWDRVVEHFGEAVSQRFDVPLPDLSGCEYFDLDARRWLEPPRRVSSVRCSRLVLVHPGAREQWGGATESMVVQSLETLPRQKRAWALTRRDLSALYDEQLAYHAQSSGYAADLEALSFYSSPDVELAIVEVTADGWCALATHPDLGARFGIRAGETTAFADRPVGSPFLA